MPYSSFRYLSIVFAAGVFLVSAAQSRGFDHKPEHCKPDISFVEFASLDLETQLPITMKGKLMLPRACRSRHRYHSQAMPAVLILHGSGGVDSRGDFYARALNAVGIATLEIDMWEARGVTGVDNRPALPILSYPDAFASLAFLANHDAIDPNRIGVLGFSWGGVMSLAAAEELYADQFGQGLQFAAHVANYPVCYGANNPAILPLGITPAQAGTQIQDLTGAPLMIQVGTEDDYDNGADNCEALVDQLAASNNGTDVSIAIYPDAFHAWDRLQVPITVPDPFGDEGSFFTTGVLPLIEIIPDVALAYEARRTVVGFFVRNL